MNQSTKKTFLAGVLSVCVIGLSACGGSAGANLPEPQTDVQQVDTGTPSTVLVANDASESALHCPGGEFDHAQLLFTERDRQWTCAISSSEFASTDDIYFNQKGSATFTRFGDVYWNRATEADEINIASPFISGHVLRNITSANTTLQFELMNESGAAQEYDCVLVQRDDIS